MRCLPTAPRPQVAIKLEVAHTLPDSREPVGPERARAIKAALRGARLCREWAAYGRLGAVAGPGERPVARLHGVPLVHAMGARGAWGEAGGRACAAWRLPNECMRHAAGGPTMGRNPHALIPAPPGPVPSHAGHAALEGRAARHGGGGDGAAGSGGGGSGTPLAPPKPLHHCVWMAMELLGPDLWAAREAGGAFGGRGGAADVAAAGQAALRVRT
jgi:hypothetical protein